jgi:hypothetical protein
VIKHRSHIQNEKGIVMAIKLRVAALALSLVLVAGTSVGAARSRTVSSSAAAAGKVTLCVKKRNGTVRVLRHGKRCRKGERKTAIDQTGPTGSTGATGAPGEDGIAKAFALIKPDGTVPPANAKLITDANVFHASAGRYCIHDLPFAPAVVVANGSILAGRLFIHASVASEGTTLGGCPSNSQIFIDIYNDTFTGVDTSFYVMVE